jgi:hypothetical protein
MKKSIVRSGLILASLVFLTASAPPGSEPEWYVSNGSGMALEKTFKTRALHEKHALQVMFVGADALPRELRRFHSAAWRIECRILYEEGKRVRTQWSFWDSGDIVYFVASISNDGAGFIEWYNDKGLIVEEQRLDADGSGYFISYTYKDSFLVAARSTAIGPYKKPESAETPKPEAEAAAVEASAITDEDVEEEPEPEEPDEAGLLGNRTEEAAVD